MDTQTHTHTLCSYSIKECTNLAMPGLMYVQLARAEQLAVPTSQGLMAEQPVDVFS